MPSPNSDPPDPATGFDPNRHRKEIELMEKRFRERSERHGGGPVSTGEIDSRVADEMRQFFDASAQQLETVVPQLQTDERAQQMAETTGEIRKKIDDFFAQVKDAGGGEKSPSSQELVQRKSKWVGMFPGQDFDGPAPASNAPRRAAPPPPPAPAAPSPRATMAQPARQPAPAAGRAAPTSWAPPSSPKFDDPAPSSEPVVDGAKMDLKSALEKLRRHGVMKEEGAPPARRPSPPAAAPRPAPTAPRPEPRPEPVQRAPRPDDSDRLAPADPAPRASRAEETPRPQRRDPAVPQRPAAPQPAPAPAPAPAREASTPARGGAQPLPPVPPSSSRREPAPSRVAAQPAAPAPSTSEPSVPVRAGAGTRPAAPVAPRREAPAPAAPDGPRQQFGGRAYASPTPGGGPRAPVGGARLVQPYDRTGPVIDRPRQPRIHPAAVEDIQPVRRETPIRSARPAAPESESVPVAPLPAPRRAAPPEDVPAPAADSGDSFDSIFKEVEGIVLGTLQVSVDETFEAAREAEVELSAVAMPTLRESESEPVSESVSEAVSQLCANQPDSNDIDFTDDPEVCAAPAAPAARAPQRGTRFARPSEDEDSEEDAPAPSGPYNWGVKPSAKPKGAWLLDTPDESIEAGKPKTITSETNAGPSSAPVAGAGGGARGYLVRKANEEVRRFEPVLKALKSANVLDTHEIGSHVKAAAGPDDEFVSAESFKDNRPTPEELDAELSPMRLVEELRRLKRVTQALMVKGIITQEDLNKAQGD